MTYIPGKKFRVLGTRTPSFETEESDYQHYDDFERQHYDEFQRDYIPEPKRDPVVIPQTKQPNDDGKFN